MTLYYTLPDNWVLDNFFKHRFFGNALKKYVQRKYEKEELKNENLY